MGAPTVAQRYQGVEKHSSGFRLLSAMGWKEGEGLVRLLSDLSLFMCSRTSGAESACCLSQGAKKQGIKSHVKVSKKHDSAGVGAVRRWPSLLWASSLVSVSRRSQTSPSAAGGGYKAGRGLDAGHGSLRQRARRAEPGPNRRPAAWRCGGRGCSCACQQTCKEAAQAGRHRGSRARPGRAGRAGACPAQEAAEGACRHACRCRPGQHGRCG